jgi:hypothetical protein
MPLDTVASIAYKNQWDGSQGPMHTSLITFASGLAGEANHKQPTPPYRVGEVVEYQITGEFRGTNKLKVGKPKDGAPAQSNYVPPAHQPQAPHAPAPQSAGNGQQWRPKGESVGMALNQACEFNRATGQPFNKTLVHQIASDLLRLGRALEAGQLAPLAGPIGPTTPSNIQPQPAPPPSAPPPQRPKAGPDGQAFNPEADFDSSVDF